ncbi:hypothetical protein PAPHI01_0101 [Pancytospora philotis]|nr:hypothetical protein PAPHI01_0101 [Pancytospora philotis]
MPGFRSNSDSDPDFDSENDEFLRSYTKTLLEKSRGLAEYTDEHELIELTQTQTMVVHFYRPSFPKCVYMNNALRLIAPKFAGIKFGCINVDAAPKMTESLEISVLPFLAFFRGGYFVDQHVGFEQLGNSDRPFDLNLLESYIRKSPVSTGAEPAAEGEPAADAPEGKPKVKYV